MGVELIPEEVRKRYRVEDRDHACAILATDFPNEFKDMCDCLTTFSLKRSAILTPGGGKSLISKEIDKFLSDRGWDEKSFNIEIRVFQKAMPVPTYRIDNFKNRVGLEVEWNNKTEFYDRDLNNFRLLKELRVLAVGVIVTRMSELQDLFNKLGKGPSYGPSTTHWKKLIPKVDGVQRYEVFTRISVDTFRGPRIPPSPYLSSAGVAAESCLGRAGSSDATVVVRRCECRHQRARIRSCEAI